MEGSNGIKTGKGKTGIKTGMDGQDWDKNRHVFIPYMLVSFPFYP
jgi:hypothetical protein